MANGAKITIRVDTTRGGTNITARSVGRSGSQPVAGVIVSLPKQGAQPNATPEQFWAAVLPIVQAAIVASETA